jgi:hypothetical protein
MEPRKFLFNPTHGLGSHDIRPQYEVRGNQIFTTPYNQNHSTLPQFKIEGNNIHATEYHPAGAQKEAWFQIRGNEIHSTAANPSFTHSGLPSFHMGTGGWDHVPPPASHH